MQIDLSGRVVLVTGAARGIGRTIAETFAREGAHVVAMDLDADALAGMEQDSHAALALPCDITDPAQVREAVAAIEERFGRLDVLINNAGINAEGPLESFDPELWDRLFAVNVRGVLNTCQAVIPLMKRQRAGRIINAASFAAVIPSVDAAAYGASKAAVVQMTRVLASELGPWGITVNAYAPGMIPTAMNGFAALGEEAAAAKLDQLSVRRWGVPEDVAKLCLFLASDLSDYVTGALLDVSGGKFATQDPGAAWRAL
ncbi:SDR family NAD(P)-dependent oxidoreductase [Brachybacterium massiliense]|uniref:SDR family NAD(P)-dependent oxidoreductase n=1 Tax=Brachybacterium massiliense TaxID=1755098 RepID=UPI000B3BB49E|nr:SDR family NAD(P)-dependent oxidoreductase [Brachybacterium massiliense]